jgi:type II secretory pathway component GspD/PulD (secretin)
MKIYTLISLMFAIISSVHAQTNKNSDEKPNALKTSGNSVQQRQLIKIVSDEKTNSLIINAPEHVLKQIEVLVKDLDEENRNYIGLKVIQLVHLQASEITPLLQTIMASYKPTPIKSSQLGLLNNSWNSNVHGIVLGDDRTNKVIIQSDKTTTANLEKIVRDLDKKTNIIDNTILLKIKNADATLVANLIQNVSGRR